VSFFSVLFTCYFSALLTLAHIQLACSPRLWPPSAPSHPVSLRKWRSSTSLGSSSGEKETEKEVSISQRHFKHKHDTPLRAFSITHPRHHKEESESRGLSSFFLFLSCLVELSNILALPTSTLDSVGPSSSGTKRKKKKNPEGERRV